VEVVVDEELVVVWLEEDEVLEVGVAELCDEELVEETGLLTEETIDVTVLTELGVELTVVVTVDGALLDRTTAAAATIMITTTITARTTVWIACLPVNLLNEDYLEFGQS